jgi:hypothetical protein
MPLNQFVLLLTNACHYLHDLRFMHDFVQRSHQPFQVQCFDANNAVVDQTSRPIHLSAAVQCSAKSKRAKVFIGS